MIQGYARGFQGGPFEFHGFRLPFIYSTNGEIFWFQDLRREDRERLQKWTFSGSEIVLDTRRLAMMNLASPRGETERFRRFTRDEITKRDDNLDIFWLKDELLQDADGLPEPEDLVSEAVTQLETALDALRDLALQLQENGR